MGGRSTTAVFRPDVFRDKGEPKKQVLVLLVRSDISLQRLHTAIPVILNKTHTK